MRGGKMSNEDEFVPILGKNELEEGLMKNVSAEDVSILLVKLFGQIFAVSNRCPHMGCSLGGGTLEGYIITCPCHDWRFDLRTGEFQEAKEITLTTFEWRIESGKICIRIADDIE